MKYRPKINKNIEWEVYIPNVIEKFAEELGKALNYNKNRLNKTLNKQFDRLNGRELRAIEGLFRSYVERVFTYNGAVIGFNNSAMYIYTKKGILLNQLFAFGSTRHVIISWCGKILSTGVSYSTNVAEKYYDKQLKILNRHIGRVMLKMIFVKSKNLELSAENIQRLDTEYSYDIVQNVLTEVLQENIHFDNIVFSKVKVNETYYDIITDNHCKMFIISSTKNVDSQKAKVIKAKYKLIVDSIA